MFLILSFVRHGEFVKCAGISASGLMNLIILRLKEGLVGIY
uniref:Uncharacterized protein n=1 Tax=Rhizophora mucronata TaxID=61149 RepID=A0A2P2QEY6_RHIMU